MDVAEKAFEPEPEHIRHVLASYDTQANLSGAPVFIISEGKRSDGSALYNLITAGVHYGISHEKPSRGAKHPASAFACYIPFDFLVGIVDLMSRKK